MNTILSEIRAYLDDFNRSEEMSFSIDSIRIDFSKEHKLDDLRGLGEWMKIGRNSNILRKLKKRLHYEELTSAHRLKGHDVYFYNLKDPPKYRRARMVIFGLDQYHKEPTPEPLITRILRILKDVTNIDVCFDTSRPPKIDELSRVFDLKRYITKSGVLTDTYYINRPCIQMIERIIFYDKAQKNNLSTPLWRMEALVTIPNWKLLVMPLRELEEVTALAWSKQ